MAGYRVPKALKQYDYWYKVTVDDRVWVARYSSAANAVFGALRRLEYERAFDSRGEHHIHVEQLPPKPTRMPAAAYTRKLKERYGAL